MRCSKLTKSWLRGYLLRGTFLAATAAVMFFSAPAAKASCGDPGKAKSGLATQMPFLKHANAGPNATNSSIVGLWHVNYTSGGELFYEAFDVWHNDGTEFEIANLPPATGNVCMGVWKKDGQTVELNHVGWAFDNNGNPLGMFTLTEKNVVNGDTYQGTFDYKAYDVNGTVVQEIKGTLAATRIPAN
jgi:hypothetical protein